MSHSEESVPEALRIPPDQRIRELEDQLDERDEIIRQLNEALSLALDELTAQPDLAA